jgi:hypothetical protein
MAKHRSSNTADLVPAPPPTPAPTPREDWREHAIPVALLCLSGQSTAPGCNYSDVIVDGNRHAVAYLPRLRCFEVRYSDGDRVEPASMIPIEKVDWWRVKAG